MVANKAENQRAREGMSMTVHDCYRLGFGEPVAISASTGEGMVDLYGALQPWIDAAYISRERGGAFLPASAALTTFPLEVDNRNKSSAGGQREEVVHGNAVIALDEIATEYSSSDSEDSENDESSRDDDTVDGEPLPRPIIRMAILGQPNVVRGSNWVIIADKVINIYVMLWPIIQCIIFRGNLLFSTASSRSKGHSRVSIGSIVRWMGPM